MKKTKLLVSMVATVSIIAVSAGCSSTGGGQQGGQASPAATSSANVADTVKSITKLKNPNVKVKAYRNYSPSTVPAIGEAVKEFEEKYGGKVEWTEINWGSDFKELPAAVAAGDVEDLHAAEGFQVFPNWMAQNLIQPISSYVNFKDAMWDKASQEGSTYKGQVYGINTVKAQAVSPYIVYYNKTLFQENGLKTPFEYYKEGNWNWKTFLEVATKLTKDTDGDGKVDQYGFNWGGNPTTFMVHNGGNIVNVKSDGTLEAVFDSPNNRNVLQMMQDLVFKNKAGVGISQDRFGLLANRKVAMMHEGSAFILEGLKPSDKHKDEYDFVPYPVGDSTGDKTITPYNDMYWVVPTGAKNVEGAALLATTIAKHLGEVQYDKFKKALDDEHMKMFDKILASAVPDFRQKFAGVKMPAIGKIYAEGNPVATEVENMQKELKAQVDEYNAKLTK